MNGEIKHFIACSVIVTLLCMIPNTIFFVAYKFWKKENDLPNNTKRSGISTVNSRLFTTDFILDILYKALSRLSLLAIVAACASYVFLTSPIGEGYSKKPIILFGDIPSFVLTAMMGVLGMLSVSTAINRKYRAFVSTQDLLLANKVGQRAVNCVLYFILYGCLHIVVACIEIADVNSASRLFYYFMFQVCGLFLLYLSVIEILRLLFTVLNLLHSDDPRLLKKHYIAVHNITRNRNESLNSQNYYSIDACINFLISGLFDSDKIKAYEAFNEKKVTQHSFFDAYDDMPFKIQAQVFASSLLLSVILSFIATPFFFGISQNSLSSTIAGFLAYIFVDIVYLAIVFKKKGALRNFYIRGTIGTWGLRIEEEKDKYCYISLNKRIFFRMKQNTEYQKCIRQIYSLVSLFRDALDTEHQIAEHCLCQIAKNFANGKSGCLAYILCLHLFCQRFPDKKETAIKKFHEQMPLELFEQRNLPILSSNCSELAKDVLRDGEIHDCSYLFQKPVLNEPQKMNEDLPCGIHVNINTKKGSFKFDYNRKSI